MKKILVTGVFASGKTSLISLLKSKLENDGKKVAIFSEVARDCPFNLNLKQNTLSTSWLIMRQIKNEIALIDENYDFAIFDRGIPDIIAHTRYTLNSSMEDKWLYDEMEMLGKVSLNNFHHVFLSKRSDMFRIEVDGMRVDDITYQKSLEEIHINYLDKQRVKFVTLAESNSDRLKQIMPLLV
ncbi:AAA family ATPase [Shewanella sp. 08P_2]|uniref:AAA family ATPase n=1 Tax=Shewanella oncorhynchi TaxID=2726434 RepID=UPI00103FD099